MGKVNIVNDLTALEATPAADDYIVLIDKSTGEVKTVTTANLTRVVVLGSIPGRRIYVVDAAETDQGAAGEGKSVKDFVNAIGSASATLLFTHSGAGSTTTYTLTTSETTPDNITVIMEHGAILDGAGTLTINGPFEADLSPHFGASITIVFGTSQPLNIEWWGVSTAETAANNRTYANKAIAAAINKGKLKVNDLYEVSDVLQVTIAIQLDSIFIEGNGVRTGFYQATAANPILETTATGADLGWANFVMKDIYLYSDGTATDGLCLRRCDGFLENVKVHNVSANGFNFQGCIEISGGRLWVHTADVGFRFGCYHSATKDFSTNMCSLALLRCNSAVTSGLLFEADGTNSLEPKGNLINGFEYGGGDTAKVIHFKGGRANTIIRPWIEEGDVGVFMEDDDDATYDPNYNRIIHPYFSSQDGTEIDIDQGSDNIFDGGYMPSPSQVDIAADCNRNKFLYLRNFPVTAGTLNDAGTGTLILSHGEGGSDHTLDYHSFHMTFANARYLRWLDSGGTDQNILGVDANDRVRMFDYAGAEALRITENAENQQYNPVVFRTKTQQLTANTNFNRGEGNLFFLTTDGSAYNFNPSGTFILGATAIIFNLDGAQTITFDKAGLALAIATGKIALCSYDGTNWRGALIN